MEEKVKLSKYVKAEIRKIIDENIRIGGNSWRDYSTEELIEIYGYLPSFAQEPK